MSSVDHQISRSPTPPEPDDDGEEWPVHGIVGEDIDVFGISSYEVRWQNWTRPDGTNTTWMRDIEGDPVLVPSWNEAIREQRLRKAAESQSIDLLALASTPMHDRLTFERAQAVEEKMAERLRKGPPGKVYQGWMAEIERKVAHHEQRGGRKPPSSTASRKRNREPSPSLGREAPHAESSRSAASQKPRFSKTLDDDDDKTVSESDR